MELQKNLDTRRACFAGKTKGMQVTSHIRQDKTTGLYQLLCVENSIIYSIHHIKKENIGLIEVMGLAVLPARLKKEMAELEQANLNREDLRQNETVATHAEWAEGWIPKYKITDSNIHSIIQKEIGIVFAKVLEDAGVYKRTDEGKAAFKRFIESL